MYFAKLDNRSLIEISGEEAETFLDNLITCKVVGLGKGKASFGALLTPQGKIMFDFFLIKTEDGFLIDTAESLGTELIKRLTFYKLRAKVEIKPSAINDVIAVWTNDLNISDLVQDPRHPNMGFRVYNPKIVKDASADYQMHRIECGIPEGGIDFEYNVAYPHEVLMDQFAGVDFKKGCYVGQEVVSRMQHRGTTKKRVIHITSDQPLPPTGTPILADEKSAGTLGSVNGKSGLALVRLDRVAKANLVEADGVALKTNIQDWVNFKFPEPN